MSAGDTIVHLLVTLPPGATRSLAVSDTGIVI